MRENVLSSLIEAIYDAALEPDGWWRLPPRLANAFEADSSAIVAWDIGSKKSTMMVATDNYTPATIADYRSHYYSKDLWLAKGVTLPRFTP